MKEITDWYDNWHLKHGMKSWRGPNEYKHIIGAMGLSRGDKLLDVGCGTGYFLKAVADRGVKTYGIDISKEAVKLSKRTSPLSNISVRSMENLNGTGPFDYVTALGSLEHCPSIGKALSEIHRVLSSEGTLIVLVPNSDYVGPEMSIQEEIMETKMSMQEWKGLFHSAGFRVYSTGYEMIGSTEPSEAYQFVFSLRKD